MKTLERIWIDEHGGYWSPVNGGTQQREYTPADLLTAAQAEIVRLKAERYAATVERDDAMALFHAADHQRRAMAFKQKAMQNGGWGAEQRHDPDTDRDAALYRWLRTRNLDAISAGGVFAGKTPENVVLNGDDLDAAIDLAMVAGDSGADDRLQLSPRFQKLYDQACARDALDAEQGLHQRLGLATTEAEVARFKASMRQQRARVRRVAAAMVTRIRRDDYPDELGNTPPDTFAWGVRIAAEIIVGGRDTRAAHKLREEEANLQEARGKLHDLMGLPKDADLEIARQWAKEAYDLLS